MASGPLALHGPADRGRRPHELRPGTRVTDRRVATRCGKRPVDQLLASHPVDPATPVPRGFLGLARTPVHRAAGRSPPTRRHRSDRDAADHRPRRPAPPRRPLRRRSEQGARRAGRRARRRGTALPRDVAPPEDGPRPGRPRTTRPRRPVRPARGLRGRARQRWLDGVLGGGDVRPRARPCAVPHLRRVRLEVRVRREVRAVPRRSDRAHGRPGQRARLRGRGRRRRLRDTAQRDLDGRRDHADPRDRRRRGRAHGVRRDQRGRWSPGRPARVRRLLLRAAEVLRVRRRSLVRPDVAPRDRARRADPGRPAATSRRSSTCRRPSTTADWSRPTTPPHCRRSC